MSGSKFIADGLWHCLCPSYSTSAISHGRNTIIRRRRPAFQYLSGKTSLRRQSSQAPLEAAPSDEVKDDGDIQSFVQPLQQSSSQAHHGPIKAPTLDVWAPLDDDKKKLPKPAINTKVRTRGINRWAILEEESTPTLYELARTAGFRGARDEVKRIVEHLVRDRKEAPNLRLYSALILSNVDPETGAAWRVASLLDEMQQEGLTLDVGLCHDVLKVSRETRQDISGARTDGSGRSWLFTLIICFAQTFWNTCASVGWSSPKLDTMMLLPL